MKVLITGANGQLGQDVVDVFADHDLLITDVDELDITNEAAVWSEVTAFAPDLIVNSAAYTAVDKAEDQPDLAHRINAIGPWWLARAADHVGATIVQVSTDYVFGAPRTRPWTEFDPVSPLGVYGETKAAGEALVRETCARHHIVRTAWVFGARGANFVKTMLRVGAERGELGVVGDQVGSPTHTRDLAAAIHEIASTGRYGTVHRTNSGVCSWYDFALAIFEDAGMPVRVHRIETKDYPTPAERPRYSVLSDVHATAMGLTPMAPWRDALRRMLAELHEAGGLPDEASPTDAVLQHVSGHLSGS